MGGWSISRTRAARRRSEALRRLCVDTLAVAGLLALWWAWWGLASEPGLTRAEAALACARGSDGTDGSIARCYTVRGLPVPADL